jgi:hypothetical protein
MRQVQPTKAPDTKKITLTVGNREFTVILDFGSTAGEGIISEIQPDSKVSLPDLIETTRASVKITELAVNQDDRMLELQRKTRKGVSGRLHQEAVLQIIFSRSDEDQLSHLDAECLSVLTETLGTPQVNDTSESLRFAIAA